ncbi:MAG: NERD domain-containing protein [Rhodospirillales bacterium]|nr:NERD domain-containing protein [Rhodospirillales bacterium]
MDAQEAQPDHAASIGALGEALVAGSIRDLGWPMLRNVVLRERGRSTEIDVIARAPSALVVLEVKTWSGFIEGAPLAPSWTRHGRGAERTVVTNAVRQNQLHVEAIARAIRDKAVPVWGLVVSAGHARFAPALCPHVVPVAELPLVLHARAQVSVQGTRAMERAWTFLSREAERSSTRMAAHIAQVQQQGAD